jgi:hypothetical protein
MDRQLVVVRWNDAQDHAQKWVDAADAEAFTDVEVTVTSIGFLVRRTDKYVTIAGDYDPIDNDYGRVTKIPSGMVKEIKLLYEETSNLPS